jgi:guanidinoacetate N-methyltransferase
MRENEKTYQSRVAIGFPERELWRNAPCVLDSQSLKILGHPVMENWETPYMKELARVATREGGIVLEVGYGMGISARFIQTHSIEHHLIIEANDSIAKTLSEFAKDAPNPVTALPGFWEDVTPHIQSGSISGILFDTYPLRKEEIHSNHFAFFREAYRLLKEGGVLTYYSDESSDFSPEHRAALVSAGFEDIEYTLCEVNPPPECLYWQENKLLVPIIHKFTHQLP